MDAKTETLIPAKDLVRANPTHIVGESAEYRAARNALLAQEIELRRLRESVAAQRRALPAGAVMTGDYRFDTENGPTDLAGLFGDKDTLVAFSFMYGPKRARPCPMCTNHLGPWDANALDAAQKLSLVVIARSPLARLLDWKAERGWKNLRLVSDMNDNYSRDFRAITPEGGDDGGINVFTREGKTVRHFWSDEMTGETADPGQDPRSTMGSPLWEILDATPAGRDPDWYPSLSYGG